MVASLALPYILNTVLSQILSVIGSLTIVAHMFTISLLFPANCIQFFNLLFPLVMFDLFPTTPLSNLIFQFPLLNVDNPLTEQFNQVGYGSMLIVENLGSMFFVMSLFPALVAVAFFVQKLFIWL